MAKNNSKESTTPNRQEGDKKSVIVERAEKVVRYHRGDEVDKAPTTIEGSGKAVAGEEEGHYGGPRKK